MDVVIKQNSPGYVITTKNLVLNYIALYTWASAGRVRGGEALAKWKSTTCFAQFVFRIRLVIRQMKA